MILIITRDSFFVISTSSTFYALLGGLGAALAVGVIYGVTLSLACGVGSVGRGLRGRGRWGVGECDPWRERGRGQVELMSKSFRGLKLNITRISCRGKSATIF